MPTAWDVLPSNVISTDRSKIAKPKIAIAIPYNGKWEPEWVSKVYIPLNYLSAGWCDKVSLLCKVPSISVARDTLVSNAIQTNCDYIFFCDTDHIFESPQDPNMALNMLYQCINKDPNSKDGKIVSGLYRSKQRHGFDYAMWTKVDDKHFTPITGWTGNWIEVDVVGLGCCLIDMEIFKKIPRPWFKWEMQEEISEDFYFFQLAKKFGYSTRVFTDIKLSHLGNLKVRIDGSITIPDM
jgi:hypothetical protein